MGGEPINGFANPLAPTITELRIAKYLPNTSFPAVTPQRKPVAITVTPQNCPGTSCRIFSLAYTTQPIVEAGTNIPRFDLTASYLTSPGVGGSGAASHDGQGAVLRSSTFTVPNPVPGNPVGILDIGTYLDEGIYANFVRRNDTRPTTLQNTLTVEQDIIGRTNVGTSDGISTCLRAALTSSGEVIARSTACLERVRLDGNNGFITSRDSTGRDPAGVRYAGNQSVMYADSLQNSVNTAGIRQDGSVYGTTGAFGSIVINNAAVAGAACVTENEIVRSTLGPVSPAPGGIPILLVCKGGVWTSATGTTIAAASSACNVSGAPGISQAGVGLICVSGEWTPNTSRFGRFAVTDTHYNVIDGTRMTKPTCPAGSDPKIFLHAQGIVNGPYATGPTTTAEVSNFRVDETFYPGEFLVVIDQTQGFGTPRGGSLPGYGVALVGCYFAV